MTKPKDAKITTVATVIAYFFNESNPHPHINEEKEIVEEIITEEKPPFFCEWSPN